jgi:AraC-like DNA-binding protein
MDTREPRLDPGHQDAARLWHADAFGGLELLRASFVQFSFAPHAHDEFMIVVTEGGAARPRFWGAEQHVAAGSFFVLNPGEVHGGGPVTGSTWRYRSFYPPAALMERVASELTGTTRGIPQFAERLIVDPATEALLRQAHLALEVPDSTLAGESHLLGALATLIARHAAGTPGARRIGREHRAVTLAKEYLETLPGENVSLDTLAQAAGIGPYHLCRVFRQETGLAPHAYQVQARVRRAKTLLAQGLPIARAAAEAGFADQAHLTRHFKRLFGVTPGRYLGKAPPPGCDELPMSRR